MQTEEASVVTVSAEFGFGLTLTPIFSVKKDSHVTPPSLIAFIIRVVAAERVPEAKVIVPPVPKTEDPLVEAPL